MSRVPRPRNGHTHRSLHLLRRHIDILESLEVAARRRGHGQRADQLAQVLDDYRAYAAEVAAALGIEAGY